MMTLSFFRANVIGLAVASLPVLQQHSLNKQKQEVVKSDCNATANKHQ